MNKDESNLVDFVKNPILIKNSNKFDIFSEKSITKVNFRRY